MSTYTTRHALPALVLAFGLAAGQATAAVIVDQNGPEDNFTVNPECSTSEVKLAPNDADKCAGYYSLDNYGEDVGSRLSDITDDPAWTFITKVEEGSNNGSGDFDGITIKVTNSSIGQSSGSWTIAWTDNNGATPYNLPIVVDIATAFKGGAGSSGGGIAYFFFEDETLTNDPFIRNGTFDLEITNALSFHSLWVRYVSGGLDDPNDEEEPPAGVPEPATLALLGLGLIGMGMLHRRRMVR